MMSPFDIVMTRPSMYEVSYVINPWMQPHRWRRSPEVLRTRAQAAWQVLFEGLESAGAAIHLLEPVSGLPDLVFPANAAVVLDGKVLLSRFASFERRREEPIFQRFFDDLLDRGIVRSIARLPEGMIQEGAGDCLWDAERKLFWAGYGQRSTYQAAGIVASVFKCEVQPLELADPRFYHLDVSFAVLEGGEVIYYPPAFSKESLGIIRDRVPADRRIEIAEADAAKFNLNIISVNGCLFLTPVKAPLKGELRERGYRLMETDLTPFLLAGGAAACLTLRLDYRRGRLADDSSKDFRHAPNS